MHLRENIGLPLQEKAQGSIFDDSQVERGTKAEESFSSTWAYRIRFFVLHYAAKIHRVIISRLKRTPGNNHTTRNAASALIKIMKHPLTCFSCLPPKLRRIFSDHSQHVSFHHIVAEATDIDGNAPLWLVRTRGETGGMVRLQLCSPKHRKPRAPNDTPCGLDSTNRAEEIEHGRWYGGCARSSNRRDMISLPPREARRLACNGLNKGTCHRSSS